MKTSFPSRTTMQNYRVKYKGHEVEGQARSPQNAVRQAIKELLRARLITKQPGTDPSNHDGAGFVGVSVERITDDEGQPKDWIDI